MVGSIAVARQLEAKGCEFVLGGVAWERLPVDPLPGPRPLAELRGAEPLGKHAALARPDSPVTTQTGARFSESHVAEFLGRPTVLIDVTGGARGAADGLTRAATELDCDTTVLVDIGGDAIALGGETGLASPLCDAVMIAAAPKGSVLSILGAGCDGELRPAEVLERIATLARAGASLGADGVTPAQADEIEAAAQSAFTEASMGVARCARGEFGVVPIRAGRRTVELGPAGAISFLFDLDRALPELPLAEVVAGSTSIEGGRRALEAIGVRTELDFELERAGRE
ncbi:DUF1152 domain-containing protein [soil metagenome]